MLPSSNGAGAYIMKTISKVIIILTLLLNAAPTWAEQFSIVKGVGKSMLITNRKQTRGEVVKHFSLRAFDKVAFSKVNIRFSKRCYKNKNYDRIINAAAMRYKVDPALVKAVMHAESSFNACAKSPKGAIGLMQLMPATARYLGVKNPYEPRENVRGGVKYLSQLMLRYKGDIKLSLAAYNAGPGSVSQYGGVPPYTETRAYINRVLSLHKHYKGRIRL